MATTKTIPNVQYNTPFGNISKIVWYDVSNQFNYFDIFFEVQLQPYKKTKLQVYNLFGSNLVWERSFPSDIDQEIINENIKLLSPISFVGVSPYGIINSPT